MREVENWGKFVDEENFVFKEEIFSKKFLFFQTIFFRLETWEFVQHSHTEVSIVMSRYSVGHYLYTYYILEWGELQYPYNRRVKTDTLYNLPIVHCSGKPHSISCTLYFVYIVLCLICLVTCVNVLFLLHKLFIFPVPKFNTEVMMKSF